MLIAFCAVQRRDTRLRALPALSENLDMRHLFPGLILITLCFPVQGQQVDSDGGDTLPSLSQDELENYQFEKQGDEVQVEVSDLSLGQQYVLSRQRREISDLLARHLGVLELQQNLNDLIPLQRLVELRVINEADTLTWQAMGVVLGDLMAHEFDLHWVLIEDEFGASKALQWKETMNFVFPVTLLSKRIQFSREIDLSDIFRKLGEDVDSFRAYEEAHPRLRLPGAERLEAE